MIRGNGKSCQRNCHLLWGSPGPGLSGPDYPVYSILWAAGAPRSVCLLYTSHIPSGLYLAVARFCFYLLQIHMRLALRLASVACQLATVVCPLQLPAEKLEESWI